MKKVFVIISLIFYAFQVNAQKYFTKNGKITFFSEAPLENIAAINNRVKVVFDESKNEIGFQLMIKDFVFKKPLMQEHFNENYLESDKYPLSRFTGEISKNNEFHIAEGKILIHGVEKNIKVKGSLIKANSKIILNAEFDIMLEDFDVKIPKIVMFNIAEEINIKVSAELTSLDD